MPKEPQTTKWPQLVFWWAWKFGAEDVPLAFRGIYRKFFWIGPCEVRFWR